LHILKSTFSSGVQLGAVMEILKELCLFNGILLKAVMLVLDEPHKHHQKV